MSDTTPNLSTPDAQTPSNQTPIASTHPPSAAVVTQTQSDHPEAPGFDALLAASHAPEDDLFDETLMAQTPIIHSPTQPIIPAATQDSPSIARPTPTNLIRHMDNRKRNYQKGANGGESLAKKRKSRKGVHTTMYNFLRSDRIKALQATYRESAVKVYHTNGIMRQIYNGFGAQCTVWAPYNHLSDLLTDPTRTRHLLTQDHHRLLFEHFAALTPGTTVAILLRSNHYFLNDDYWRPLMEKALLKNPLTTKTINGKRFFVFEGTVRSNRHADDFAKNTLTQSEIEHVCSFREGTAIRFDVHGTEDDKGNRHTIDFPFHSFFDNLETMQFWDVIPIDHFRQFKKLFGEISIQRCSAITSTYIDEFIGDATQCGILVGMFQQFLSIATQKEIGVIEKASDISTNRLKDTLYFASNDAAFKLFKDMVDSTIKDAISSIYGDFTQFTTPIITQSMLRDFENAFRQMLPTQYHAYRILIGKPAKTMEGANLSDKQKRKEQLWDRYALYEFIHHCRIRNSHNFIWFAIVNSAASYGGVRSHISIHFGYCTSQATLLRKLNTLHPYAQLVNKTITTLSNHKRFVIAIFDNSQVNIPMKFQRFGSCANMAIATCRMFAEPISRAYVDTMVVPDEDIAITYLDQAIPSPYGMPKYEEIQSWTASSLQDERLLSFEPSIDITGERVESYYRARRLISMVRRSKRLIPYSMEKPYAYSKEETNAVFLECKIPARLQPNYMQTFASEEEGVMCTFYHHLWKQLYKLTSVWRGEVGPVKLLIPPVSPDNETTNKGAANVIMSLLLMHGVLEATSNEGANGNLKGIRLSDDYRDRYVMLVGDGLSQIRAKTFEKMIEDSSYRFKDTHKATEMIRNALKQVIHITGDLHGGRFHFLSAIYSLFYGSMIQFFQLLLGWKRIRGTDVTKCYQQAAGLALMVAEQLDKMLMSECMLDLKEGGTEAFQRIENEQDAKELAFEIAKRFKEWLLAKQESTDDDLFRMAINFVLLVDDYREFRMALNTGDAVMVEKLYCEFLPNFYSTSKKHYIEIILSMIDSLYHKIGHRRLQMVRLNRTAPLHGGVDRQGIPMANWSLDGIIELVQKYYHQMKFNSEEGWAKHTPHVMLTSKAQRFVQSEYTRTKNTVAHDERFINLNDSSEVHDPNRNRQATAIKCRAKEKLAIANYIKILSMTTETPGRKYDKKAFITALSKVEVTLDDEDENERARRRMEQARSEDEGTMAAIIDEIFENANRPVENNNSNTEIDMSINNGGEFVVNGVNQDRLGEEIDGDDLNAIATDEVADNENVDDHEECAVPNIDGRNVEIVNGATNRKFKCHLANVNELCFVNIRMKGRELIQKANPYVTRFRKGKRNERMGAFYKTVHDECVSENGNDLIGNAFDRLRNKSD